MNRFDDLEFRKSSFSQGDQQCVEVALAGDQITTGAAVRDTKNRQAGTLTFANAASWRSFLQVAGSC